MGPVLDLLPPQVWSIMPPSKMVGIPKLFKVCLWLLFPLTSPADIEGSLQIIALEHPKGSDKKTKDLIKQMSAADLEVFPIDVAKMNLRAWHLRKAQMFRKQFLKSRKPDLGSAVVAKL